jgi:endonuclease I
MIFNCLRKFIMILMIGLISSFRNSIINNASPEIYNLNSLKIDNGFMSLEHIFPKCYMNKKSFNDLHNIFKCNNLINNCRSNYKYTDERLLNIYEFKQLYDTDNFISNKNKLFIPEEASRGIIARSIMYMSFEYNYKFNKVIDSDILIKWCLNYPPNSQELYHNHIVFLKQYKKNKFIDLYYKKNYKSYILKLFS